MTDILSIRCCNSTAHCSFPYLEHFARNRQHGVVQPCLAIDTQHCISLRRHSICLPHMQTPPPAVHCPANPFNLNPFLFEAFTAPALEQELSTALYLLQLYYGTLPVPQRTIPRRCSWSDYGAVRGSFDLGRPGASGTPRPLEGASSQPRR